jgi:hypothetical protein
MVRQAILELLDRCAGVIEEQRSRRSAFPHCNKTANPRTLQLALVMAGSGIASRLATLVAVRIAQPICLRLQQRVQRLLHATPVRHGRGSDHHQSR